MACTVDPGIEHPPRSIYLHTHLTFLTETLAEMHIHWRAVGGGGVKREEMEIKKERRGEELESRKKEER